MSFSSKGLNWLKGIEKLALTPYDDQTGKKIHSWCKGATIGYGHLISQFEWNRFANGISEEEAEELLIKDLLPFVRAVSSVPRILTQTEFDACVILAFNIGQENFKNSTVCKMVSNPKYRSNTYPSLRAAWMAWNKSQGKINKGVINRRSAEWDMYSRGIYRYW